MKIAHLLCAVALLMVGGATVQAATPSFADFDRRAKNGERLTVVFFGASLTWGANSTDPINTSYRAVMADYLEEYYPKAHFKFYDAAIGGTGSQLGVFRLGRDVLRRNPDLVFLDFSANDDIYSDNPESTASYESLVRRIIVDGHAPVVQVIFPFGWNVSAGKTDGMKRRDAHIAISKAYNTGCGDAISLGIQWVKEGKATIEKIWPNDQVHPGDFGYHMFATAAWDAYRDAVKRNLVCKAPEKMLNADTYMQNARVRISTLGAMPKGWRVGTPGLVAAWHDGLMSRWLDDEVIASNRAKVIGADGKDITATVTPDRLKVRFIGSRLLLFGEKTMKSGTYQLYIDGKLFSYTPWGAKEPTTVYNASAKQFGGSVQLVEMVSTNLAEDTIHTLEIEPLLTGDDEQELRLESICVAGKGAKVLPAE